MAKRKPLSERDLDFVAFALDQHMELVKRKKAPLLSPTRKTEKQSAMKIMANLRTINVSPTTKHLSEQDFWVLDFTLTEYDDLLIDGECAPWASPGCEPSGKTGLGMGKRVMAKIKSLASITPEAYEMGPSGTINL